MRTFAAADGLAKVIPETTEEAQYSLLWPLASALARGRFGVAEVLGPFTDPDVRAMFERIEIEVDPELTAAFPARRLTAVRDRAGDGASGLRPARCEAVGEPDDPRLAALVAGKVRELVRPVRSERSLDESGLRDARPVAAAGDAAPRRHGAGDA